MGYSRPIRAIPASRQRPSPSGDRREGELIGARHWDGLVGWIRGELVGTGRIAPADVELLRATDDPDEVCTIADAACARQRAAYGEDPGR